MPWIIQNFCNGYPIGGESKTFTRESKAMEVFNEYIESHEFWQSNNSSKTFEIYTDKQKAYTGDWDVKFIKGIKNTDNSLDEYAHELYKI